MSHLVFVYTTSFISSRKRKTKGFCVKILCPNSKYKGFITMQLEDRFYKSYPFKSKIEYSNATTMWCLQEPLDLEVSIWSEDLWKRKGIFNGATASKSNYLGVVENLNFCWKIQKNTKQTPLIVGATNAATDHWNRSLFQGVDPNHLLG